ncbi:helix-turn-helix protein [Gelidibacter algens]|uniref:Helix-turn-helix protein n=1 Tax=Gelidibacter algens TaxID=49280 RepID=A0A1A7R2X9_9FLAO|nr:helix-turn-helix domain-containing protein [Gelidibacter algens]OBX25122.1 hypothetical protein A9996_11495 [Gelidibacter algens]RAJ20010.1 helix-turn-helix protein [Gelidibacter algens]
MKAETFKPSPALSAYIENYMLFDIDWRNVTEISNIWRLIPYGKVAMFFHYGDTYEYSFQGALEPMQRENRAILVGPLTKPVWMKFTGHSRLINIQFKSCGAQAFVPINMAELRNWPSLDLLAVWGSPVNEFLEQLEESPSDTDRIIKLNSFLEKRLLPQPDLIDYVDYTIQQLKANNGTLSIKGLEQKLGISTRQLERLFLVKIGVSPKKMGKLIRLNSAFTSLQTNPDISLTTLSYDAGYYDQSHFCRDFKSITGTEPTKLLSKNTNELFITHGGSFVQPGTTILPS